MAKKDFPKIDRDRDAITRRPYAVHNKELEAPSSIVIYFNCPFCGHEVRAYLWSLKGGGKRCGCGAYHGSRGLSHHWQDDARRQACIDNFK